MRPRQGCPLLLMARCVGPGATGPVVKETAVASNEKLPGTSVEVGRPSEAVSTRSRSAPVGHLPVSELAADRPGGPSPFGDDIEFPLPVEELRYTHTTTP